MISWVDGVLKNWGRAQYWLMFKGNGFPARTILGKLMEEGAVGAACNQYTREFPEVLMGENLIVANAVKTLSEEPQTVIRAHYVIRMPAKQKYSFAGITKYRYYEIIDQAHVKLANAIDAQDARISGLTRQKVSRTVPPIAE